MTEDTFMRISYKVRDYAADDEPLNLARRELEYLQEEYNQVLALEKKKIIRAQEENEELYYTKLRELRDTEK